MLLFKSPLSSLPSSSQVTVHDNIVSSTAPFPQILPVLSQIASVWSPNRSHTNRKSSNSANELCSQHSGFNDVSQKVFALIEDGILDKEALEYVLNCRSNIKISGRENANRWHTSYVSDWSFDDNKYGTKLSSLSLVGSLNLNLLRNFNSPTINTRRTFITKRRDTGFYGLGSKSKSESDSKISSFLKLRKSEKESDKLKTLISDENLSEEERQRVKIAFAEGYAAADPKKKTGSYKIFYLVRDLLGIIFILIVLSSLLGEISGGPFKRFIIGGGNEVHSEEIDVTFDDVKGVDEAKQELQEVVEFLKNPDKFSALGGKLPKGVLLVGPPGTGKTLLARAVAGEAGVPFFHAAGPEFDEILVGQGARRVRDLFSAAKIRAPCVIFIDEIDSVGAKRTNSVLHPYANQTINQLLTEMDGFRQNEGVVVLGATNRRDDLDKALLRPGRFDVEVQVPVPDLQGRSEILRLYLGKVKTGKDVDIDVLARRTTGFTGADIENMVNQAALRAAIDGQKSVAMKYLENARDKVLMGPERKSRIPDEEANRITAYHESGHALVAYFTKDATPIHKVTIVSRGPSLGHTAYIPEKESYHVTKSQMEAWIDAAMGGRAAEELIFGTEKVTSGSFSDLKEATAMATRMVKDFGMSEKVGVRTFEDDKNNIFAKNDLSDNTAEVIDAEIKRILQDSYERAKNILRTHSKEHKMVAEALLKYETLDLEDLKAVLHGKEPKVAKLKNR